MSRKYSKNLKQVFTFFLKCHRKGIITFCGSRIDIKYSKSAPSAIECFKRYENGFYKDIPIETKHPNILNAVLIAKKGWSLWVNEWTDGISEFLFTKNEILSEFKGVHIPSQLMNDFNNRLEKKHRKRNELRKLAAKLSNITGVREKTIL